MSIVNDPSLNFNLVQNQTVPPEGPKAIPLFLDFTSVATYELNLLLRQETGFISMIQTLYIDLSNTANALTVVVKGSGQIIKAKARTQGYYPILCPNPPELSFTSTSPGDNPIPVYMINVPIAGLVWATQ